MKKIIGLMVIIMTIVTSSICYGYEIISNESKYGKELDYQTNADYPGEISIDGLYVYQDESNYIFTILYSHGELVQMDHKGILKTKTSFFNPPSGNVIEVSWRSNFDKITSDDHKIQYHIEKEDFETLKANSDDSEWITVFLYDVLHNNNDENISVYFRINQLYTSEIPDVSTLVTGHEITNESLDDKITISPSNWALKNIEELQYEDVLREDVFTQFNEGINRERFVYLMVNLYEQLTSTSIKVDPDISFSDSHDLYVEKAASIGITSGIGNGMFGPELIINREQMATFIMKTLNLAGIDIVTAENEDKFFDDSEISDWAKASTYCARANDIISGVGNNQFDAKGEATNEQALYLTHKLLRTHGNLKWFNEYDGNRFYLKYNEELYKVNLEDDILLIGQGDDSEILFKSYQDINTFLNLLYLNSDNLQFSKSVNPNFVGTLENINSSILDISITNMYRGVDKIGEHEILSIGKLGKVAEVTTRTDSNTATLSGFYKAKYYDLNNCRQQISTLSTTNLCQALEIAYKVEYNTNWDIVILEILSK